MKLIIAIVHERDRNRLADALSENGITFTKIGSTGGFLRQGNVTMLIGVEDADVERVLGIVKDASGSAERFVNIPGETFGTPPAIAGAHPPHPMKVEVGGAVAFVVNVEGFHRL